MMKRLFTVLTALMICLALAVPLAVSAASASASLTGPGTVRAGDTITLSFELKGSGVFGASGTLSYDSSQLTLTETKQKIASPWVVEFNGNNFVAYDNNLTNPINSTKTLFTATFKVKALSEGTKITVSFTDVTASDGAADIKLGTVSYTATIAAPLATNNDLASLNVSNATISPAFSPNVTNYTASVPFEVSKLEVAAKAADSKAKVSINSPNLTPNGTTNVTITVTAENGAKKTYTIKVYREQDPNYVPSSDNNLSGIQVEGFLLSPVFSAEVTEYVVWLPYETTNIRISGTPNDSRSSVTVVGGEELAAGADNPVQVICRAEDGTEKVYTVVVKRAAPHGGSSTEPTEPPTEPTEPPTEPTEPPTEPTEPVTLPTDPTEQENPAGSTGTPGWLLIVVGIVCLAAGAGVGIAIGKKMTGKK